MALLEHLQVRHVYLGAQSAGTVYALDLLLHHPEILHPAQGYLAIGSPWIHPSKSGTWHLSLAEALPTSLLAHSDKLASYFTMVSAPLLGKSLDLVGNLMQWLGPAAAPTREGGEAGNSTKNNTDTVAGASDEATAFAEALDPKLADFIFRNSVSGMSNETILVLQRPNKDSNVPGWSDWGDYDVLVPRLRRVLANSNRRLIVDIFLSETDAMTGDPGTAGPEWFISCWDAPSDSGDPIVFSCSVVPGTDHNSIWATGFGVAHGVFERIERLSKAEC